MSGMTKIYGTEKDERPHVYRAMQARSVIANAGRSKFIFWYECAHVGSLCITDYELWHTSSIEDAQHIIFTWCGITSVGQLEDQWLPWKKPSKHQKQWDKLYGAYVAWAEARI